MQVDSHMHTRNSNIYDPTDTRPDCWEPTLKEEYPPGYFKALKEKQQKYRNKKRWYNRLIFSIVSFMVILFIYLKLLILIVTY